MVPRRALVHVLTVALVSGVFCARPVHGQSSVPPLPERVTYIMPLWGEFPAAPDGTILAELDTLRSRIGEGRRVRAGFSVYIRVNMSDWRVDTSDPTAVRAALASTVAQIDSVLDRANRLQVPVFLNCLTAIRSTYDTAQTDSEREDRRNMQWYADNQLAGGWWTHSRYARNVRRVQKAYIRELGRVLAERMRQFPDTLIGASGDGEVELSYDRSPSVVPGMPVASTVIADYSPFAVAEFRDWLRHEGMYGAGGELEGQGYTTPARPSGYVTLDELNADFGTAFSWWDLRYSDWALTDNPLERAIDPATYAEPYPNDRVAYFDAPRERARGDAFRDVWDLFRAGMIWRHNLDFARWVTTTADDTGATVPPSRWYSYQIPADYLFGHTPQNPDVRLITSASPWWTADVSPYGSLGITAFNTATWNESQQKYYYGKTLSSVAPLIAARGVRWGIMEWHPSDPVTDDLQLYRDEMALVEQHKPSVLIPYKWASTSSSYRILGTPFETALKEFVDRNKDIPLVAARPTLYLGAVSGSVLATPAQQVRVTTDDLQPVALVATSTANFLDVSIAGSIVTIAVRPAKYAAGTYETTVQVGSSETGYRPVSIRVVLRVAQSASPAGSFDTPLENATVRGETAVTGWAVDDIGIRAVEIWRAPVSGEGGLVFIGTATPVEGARPDVAAAYPTRPQNERAGWGYMLLTNMLPNHGNGTFVLHAIALDLDGHRVTLGRRRIVAANSSATLPFGTIDTPAQGETVGGTINNWGWALTPDPAGIPTDGSTINVVVDGVAVGHPRYNLYRPDIATLFPGFANSNGAVGLFQLDTRTLSNGVHTIAWGVRDTKGNAQGIGSRYFTVFNPASGGAVTAASSTMDPPVAAPPSEPPAEPIATPQPVVTVQAVATPQPAAVAPSVATAVEVGPAAASAPPPSSEKAAPVARRARPAAAQPLIVGHAAPAPPRLVPQPAAVHLSVMVDASGAVLSRTPAQRVQVTLSGGIPSPWRATVDDVTWLTVTQSHDSRAGVLTCDLGVLPAAGRHGATVRLYRKGAAEADAEVRVSLEVRRAPARVEAERHILRAGPTNQFTYVGPPVSTRARTFARATTATFAVTYVGFESFPLAQAAFQRAVDIWATQIATTVPIAIRASFTAMSGNVLGTGGPAYVHPVGPGSDTLYATPLANQLTGADLTPGAPDIYVDFNSAFGGWHFGTDPAPAGRYDFTTVVLHEICHGLGYIGSAEVNSPFGFLEAPPFIYDRFVANASGAAIASFPSGSSQLGAQLTGGDLFWIGASGLAGNGGTSQEIYAPSSWDPGSSFSHVDEVVFPPGHPNSLMTPILGAAETILDPGPGTRGILRDLGWTVAGSGLPALTVGRNSLTFGAVRTPFTSTSAQMVAVTQSSGAAAAWTASANVPWIQVSPASGSGSGTLTIAVVSSAALPSSGTVTGRVTLSSGAAWNTPVTITVRLNLLGSGTAGPYGSFDTPINGTTGVTGSIAVTGWALDDIEVTRVRIYRSGVSPESTSAQVYVGDAVMVEGARPDVEAASPDLPLNHRAGWGYLLLTNQLPRQGNGTYTLHAYADDGEGHSTRLGSKTITCANATATKPFGAIDTPGQGATASGNAYVNFGWVLTPQPKFIPFDGSTIRVFIDGASVGTVTYNNYRNDVATLFPGYANSGGPVGYRTIDTSALSEGVHTIAWGVIDSAGAAEGIGSRYFTVRYGAALTNTVTSTATPAASADMETVPVDMDTADEVLARTGFDPAREWQALAADADGSRRAQIEELGRLELRVGSSEKPCQPAGAALPIGSRFERANGTFSWAPGPGFVGDYSVPFSCTSSTGVTETMPVTVSIAPRKTRGARVSTPQVVIDTPRRLDRLGRSFIVAGWALDHAAENGTGIATLHVWAYPVTPRGYGEPRFLGVAAYGGHRPDVGAVFGARFSRSGYSLTVRDLPPGTYDIAVFPFTVLTGGFGPASTVRVTVR